MRSRPKTTITGIGAYVPEKILTNDDLAKIVDTNDEWIRTRTGVSERHIAGDDETTSSLGTRAGEAALDHAGVEAEDLDMIIVASGSPDMIWPSTACIIQEALGAGNAAAFDVSAACASFVYCLEIADALIRAGSAQKVLLIGAETITRFIDWTDRGTCVLFGDGAGAAVLERAEDETGIIGSILKADGSRADILKIPAGGSAQPASEKSLADRQHYIKMNGNEVFKFMVQEIPLIVKELLDKYELKASDVRWFVPHQANQRITQSAAEKTGTDPDKWFSNIATYGNTSAASIPLALYEMSMAGKLSRGDIIVTIGYGAGLTLGANLLKWTL